jgi:hypothetical protein
MQALKSFRMGLAISLVATEKEKVILSSLFVVVSYVSYGK